MFSVQTPKVTCYILLSSGHKYDTNKRAPIRRINSESERANVPRNNHKVEQRKKGMTAIENNRCYACGKLFCCASCCTDHVKKKHSNRESECPLCRSERLIVKNFDNQEFLCHIVFNHLPLYCRICGSEFKNCEDLQSLGNCQRPFVRRWEKVKSPDTPSPLNKTPCGPACCATRSKNSTIDGDYNGNFGNVISPPELTRNTSTPMHVTGKALKANFVFKTPKSPFYAKTPKAGSQTTKDSRSRNETAREKENDSPSDISYKDSDSTNNESSYQSCCNSTTTGLLSDRTPLRSILSNRSMAMMGESSSYATMNINAGRKRLDAMEEIDENVRIEDITDTARALQATNDESSLRRTDSDNRQKDSSSKRVRFSDQFESTSAIDMTTSTTSDIEPADSDIFYEAHESMTEMTMTIADKLSLSLARIDDENEKNFKREQQNEESDDTKKQSIDEKLERPRIADSMPTNEASTSSSSSSSSSSRVIMMVVVEKNGSVNSNDLVPLIDSSLKKLVANNSVESLASSIESPKRKNEESRSGTSIVSVDSYMSVSTVECYKTPDTTIDHTRNPRESPESNSSVGSGGGIFAAVAHAMKLAFRNFSGARSLINVSREPIEHNQQLALLSAIPESSVSPSRVLTSLASALAPRTAKRSRDVDETTLPQRSPERVDSPNDVRSPVPKRPRGWYKIRAREPIARMRNNTVTSPRGVSSETQCFQQGSLSVGDTILTLPSRAHQSTQTD